MSTKDVPGANPKNADKLDVGCWGEDDGGDSLLHVIGREDKMVVYQVYDLRNGMFYQDSMMEDEFKTTFSAPPVGKGKTGDWTWHDKTDFPWDRVMKDVARPTPQHTDVFDEVKTAARKVANMLKLRGKKLDPADLGTARTGSGAADIIDTIADAMKEAFAADA